MDREYMRLMCVAVIAASLAGCSVIWSGNIYRIGTESPDDHRWFHSRKDCEAWVAEQKKNGTALNGSCNYWLSTPFEGLPRHPMYE
jgi:hypothetical protein